MTESDKTQETDQILSKLGNIGAWQWKVIFITGIFCCPSVCHVMIMTFMNAEVDKWCARPNHLMTMSVNEWRNISGQGSKGCEVYDIDWQNYAAGSDNNKGFSSLRSCDSWEFDQTEFLSTITSDYGLVCGRDYLTSLAQTLYFVGMVCGVFTFGVLSDMFGRRRVLIPILLAMSATGILTALMPNYVTFIIARVFNAFIVIAIFETYFTYMLEFVGGKYNTIIGMGVEFVWVAGWLLLGGLAYAIRDWRTLVLCYSTPTLASIALYWLLPESPRWLLSVGRIEEAEAIVREGAKFNKIELPEDFKLHKVHKEETKKRRTIIDLLKSPNMRTKTLILFYNWFVNAFAYFGLSLNMGQLTGGTNVYFNFIMSGLLEIPAYLAGMVILQYCGRRVPYFVSMLLCGISLLSIMLIPRGMFVNDWPAVAVTLMGKMCITFSWAVLFLYTAELLPTEVRTSGIGSSSFLGRFGGMIAPWIEVLGKNYHPYIPAIVFGVNALLAGILAIMLPETHGRDLPYTIEEAEKLELKKFLPSDKIQN